MRYVMRYAMRYVMRYVEAVMGYVEAVMAATEIKREAEATFKVRAEHSSALVSK